MKYRTGSTGRPRIRVTLRLGSFTKRVTLQLLQEFRTQRKYLSDELTVSFPIETEIFIRALLLRLSGARIGTNQTISHESKRVTRAFSLIISIFLICRVPFFLWIYSTVDSKPWVPHQIFCSIIPRMTRLGVYLNAALNPIIYGSVNQQFLISAYWIELSIKPRFQPTIRGFHGLSTVGEIQ